MPLRGGLGGLPFIGCRLWKDADEPTANGIWEYLDFNIEDFNAGGMHDIGLNPDRITIHVPGVYHVGFALEWEVALVGLRVTQIVWADEKIVVRDITDPAQITVTTNTASAIVEAGEGAYFRLRVRQNSGGVLDVLTGNYYKPIFWAYRIALPT